MVNEPIVIIDDNPNTVKKLEERMRQLHGPDVLIETASNRKEGEALIRRLKTEKVIPKKVISDLDMGRIYQPHKKWDGYGFVKWCIGEGVPIDRITLHSTAFEPGNAWKPMHQLTTLPLAKRLGIKTQGKAATLGIGRNKHKK